MARHVHIHIGKKTVDASKNPVSRQRIQNATSIAQTIVGKLKSFDPDSMDDSDFEQEIVKRLRGVSNWM
jgi:hypothetical protein